MSEKKRVIAVDFDGTLADDSRVKYPDLGPPIHAMVERVKRWVSEGHTVKLFTARLAEKNPLAERAQVKRLTEWLDIYGLHNADGTVISMTAMKLPEFDEFWDDKAVGVIRNTGATYLEAAQERTPQEVPRNEAQLEFPEWEQYFAPDPSNLHPNVHEHRRQRGDSDTPVTLEEKLASLPEERQGGINARYQDLLAAQAQQASDARALQPRRVGDAGLLPANDLAEAAEQLGYRAGLAVWANLIGYDPREPYTR